MAADYTGLVALLAPEFSLDPRLSNALGLAAGQLLPERWGNQYPTAVVYMAAHILKRAPLTPGKGDTGTIGAVTTKGARDLSEGYGLPPLRPMSITDGMLATTWYGQQLLQLRGTRARIAPVLVRVT